MKTFFIFTDGGLPKYCATIKGTLTEARAAIKGEKFEPGAYRVLEDTSGVITKAVETVQEVRIDFETPEGRKRPRSAGKKAQATK